MASTGSRALLLLSLLQGRARWSGAELAARLEVSARTLRRDVERLRELGYPVRSARGVDGGYRLAAGAALPPLVLDDEEAVALVVGLHAATTSTISGVAESSVRALAAVSAVMPARLRRRVGALRDAASTARDGWDAGPSVDAGTLVDLALACRAEVREELTYTDAAGALTHRLVEPHGLVSLGRRWYLLAWDVRRHDWRTFRLDRIGARRSEGSSFRRRTLPARDVATAVRERVSPEPSIHAVRAVVHAPEAVVRPVLGRWGAAEALGPDRCRVAMSTDSLDWAALLLGASGAELSEVSPPELLEHLRGWVGRFSRAVGPSG